MIAHLCQPVRDPGFVQDPYAFYTAARAAGEVIWWEDLGRLAATSYHAVNLILRDRRFGRALPPGMTAGALPGHLRNFHRIESASLLELDGADHGRIRARILRGFTSARIRSLEPELAQLCDRLAAGLEPGMDLIAGFATPVPLTVIARLLGVPDSDGADLLRWSHAMCRMYTPDPPMSDQLAADAACAEFDAYLRDLIARKRRAAGADLASALLADGRLSEQEIVSTLVLLLNAGHEATVHALGNAVPWLVGRADLCAPGRVAATVEECLRHDPPLHLFDRIAQQDCTVLGVPVARGQKVACLLGSANRDGTVFAAPDSFDPGRGGRGQLAFGAGVHFCLGAPLARMEMARALQALFARWPGLKVAPGPYADSWHFHGRTAVTVTAL